MKLIVSFRDGFLVKFELSVLYRDIFSLPNKSSMDHNLNIAIH